jgi:hypothetical protein
MCSEGKDPSLKEALEFANRMLFTTPGACVQATWKLDSLDATIASTAETGGEPAKLQNKHGHS